MRYVWQKRYLNLAKDISTWSKDPSTHVGAVAVSQRGQVLATGFNGFPRGINDFAERLNDRPTKYRYIVHAEANCIYNATYNGVCLDQSIIFVYGLPVCAECMKGLIQVGVSEIYWHCPTEVPEAWKESYRFTLDMAHEVGIEMKEVNII